MNYNQNNSNNYDEELVKQVYRELQKRQSQPQKNNRPYASHNYYESREECDRKKQLEKAKFEKKLKNANSRKLGFTNKLAISLVGIMVLSLFMGFFLACFSIYFQYTGALACFTICVTPLDTCLGIVLCRVVDKSKAENLGADGTGISFMTAQLAATSTTTESTTSSTTTTTTSTSNTTTDDSPAI